MINLEIIKFRSILLALDSMDITETKVNISFPKGFVLSLKRLTHRLTHSQTCNFFNDISVVCESILTFFTVLPPRIR